jgi:hypothetical protein
MVISSDSSPFWMDSLNGQYGQQLLTNCVPHIDIFDLLLYVVIVPHSQLNIDAIMSSFDYFSRKYDGRCIAMNQAKFRPDSNSKIIVMIYFLKNACCLVQSLIRMDGDIRKGVST